MRSKKQRTHTHTHAPINQWQLAINLEPENFTFYCDRVILTFFLDAIRGDDLWWPVREFNQRATEKMLFFMTLDHEDVCLRLMSSNEQYSYCFFLQNFFIINLEFLLKNRNCSAIRVTASVFWH